MTLYLDRETKRRNDQAAAAARTLPLVNDVSRLWSDSQNPPAPEPAPEPMWKLPSTESLGVTPGANPVMQAIGAAGQIGQRAQQAGQNVLSWALPSLDSLGVSSEQPTMPSQPEMRARVPEPERPQLGAPQAMPEAAALSMVGPGSAVPAGSQAPAAMPSNAPTGEIDNSSRESFVRTAFPYALRATGGDRKLAEQLVATAISENGAVGTGRSLAEMGFNVGGIQGIEGPAGSFTALDAGRPRKFAAYNDLSEGFGAVLGLIKDSPRYAPAYARYQQTGDVDRLWDDMARAGYAEDQTWGSKVASIRNGQVSPLIGQQAAARPAITSPAPAEEAPQAQQQAARAIEGIRPTQWDQELTRSEAEAACGLAGAVAFAAARGRYPTVSEAKAIAQKRNLWSEATGMYGADAEVALLREMGVAARVEAQVDWGKVRRDVQSGNPVMFDTDAGSAGHYFVVEGARQRADGQWEYNLGSSAADLRASGAPGSKKLWYTEAEIPGLGFGNPYKAIYLDDPTTAQASPTAGRTRVKESNPVFQEIASTTPNAGGPAPSPAAPPPSPWASAESPPPAGAQGDQMMMRQPIGPANMGPDTFDTEPYDPDQGPRETGYTLPGGSGMQPASGEATGRGPASTGANLAAPSAPTYDPLQYDDPGMPSLPVRQAPVGGMDDPGTQTTVPAIPPSPYQPAQAASMEPAPSRFEPSPTVTQGIVAPIVEGVQRSGQAIGRAVAETTSDDGTYLAEIESGAPGDVIEDWVRNLFGADPRPARERFTPYDPTGGKIETARRLGYALVSGTLAFNAANELWNEAGLSDWNIRVGGMEFSPLVLLLPKTVAGGMAGAAVRGAGPLSTAAQAAASRIPNVAGAIERAPGAALGATVRGAQAVGEAAGPAIGAARRVIGEGAERVGQEWQRGRELAERLNRQPERGTVAPGVFGVLPDDPAMRATVGPVARPRVVPPDVADTLDFPIRVPDDPGTIRAIEAAGGRVDPERGVDLYVTRSQSPAGAGATATRGGVFYEAIPEGGTSSFAGIDNPNGVGGSQVIPRTPTRFRSPLIISDAPGYPSGFDEAAEKLGIVGQRPAGTAAQIAKAENYLAMVERHIAGQPPTDDAIQLEVRRQMIAAARDDLEKVRGGTVPARANDIDREIKAAYRAGAPGSQAQVEAVREVIRKYGGDPSLTDELMAVRGADSGERVWAIKENIVAGNARRQGYDGVVTVQPDKGKAYQDAIDAAIQAHPRYQAAKAEVDRLAAEMDRLEDGRYGAAINRYGYDSAQAQAIRAEQDAVNRAYEAADERLMALRSSLANEVKVEPPARISELVDVREGRNPTPSTQTAAWNTAHQRVMDIDERLQTAAAEMDRVERYGTDAEWKAARKAWGEIRREYDAAVNAREELRGVPGYALREDIPRRAPDGTVANATAGVVPDAGSAIGTRVAQEVGRGVVGSMAGVTTGAATGQIETPEDAQRWATGGALAAVGARRVPSMVRTAARSGMAQRAAPPIAAGAGAALLADEASAAEPGTEGQGGPGLGAVGLGLSAATIAALAATPGGRQLAAKLAARAKANLTAPGIGKPPNALEVLQGFRYSAGLLGNITTGLINALGGPVEAGLGLGTEAVRTGVMRGRPAPVIYQGYELARGIGDDAAKLVESALGIIPQAVRNAPDFRPPLAERMQTPVTRAIGYAIDTPGRINTQAFDAFFTNAFTRWGRARAAAHLLEEAGASRLDPAEQVRTMHRWLNNPTAQDIADGIPQRIQEEAVKFAKEMTYKGDPGFFEGLAGNVLRGGAKPATSEDTVLRQAWDVTGSLIQPFFHSIYQIHKLAATRVPGLGMIANTKLPMDERVARQIVGAGVGLMAADYAAKGYINGPGPSDPDEAALVNEDRPPLHTWVPGTGWVPNAWFGSLGPHLNAIGAYYDSQRYATDKEQENSWKKGDRIAKDMIRAFKDLPTAQTGIFFYNLTQKPTDTAIDSAAGTASQFMPAPVRTYIASQDKYSRTTDREAEPPEKLRQKTISRTGYLPGLGSRQDLPVAQDRFGRPRENPRPGAAAFGLNIKQPKNDPLTAFFRENDVEIGAPKPQVTVAGEQLELTGTQTRTWQRYRGQELQRAMAELQADKDWPTASKAERKDAIEYQVRLAGQTATNLIKEDIGEAELMRRVEEAKRKKAS